MTGRCPSHLTPAAPLALLAAVTAIGFCALHIVVPVLPLLAAVFDRGPGQAQLVLTLYFVGIASGQLVYGPVSDRFGRRPVLIAGLALFLVGTAVCGLAGSLIALICGRVLEACGACAGIVLGRAIIRDVHDREAAARGIALVMMAMTLAPAMCPAIGAYLAEWFGWRAIFAVLGVLGAAVLGLTVARLPETRRCPVPLDWAGLATTHMALLRSPAFLGFALCSACSSASWFTFTASAPYLLSQLMGEPPSTYGVMILLPMAAYIVGNAVAARLALPLGGVRLLTAGLVVSCAAGVLMAAWCLYGLTVWALFVPIALSSVGNGMSQPPAVAAGLSVDPRVAGAASGLIGFLQMAVSALGTLLVAMLPHQTATGMVAVLVAFVGLALVLGLAALRFPPDPEHASARTAASRPQAADRSTRAASGAAEICTCARGPLSVEKRHRQPSGT